MPGACRDGIFGRDRVLGQHGLRGKPRSVPSRADRPTRHPREVDQVCRSRVDQVCRARPDHITSPRWTRSAGPKVDLTTRSVTRRRDVDLGHQLFQARERAFREPAEPLAEVLAGHPGRTRMPGSREMCTLTPPLRWTQVQPHGGVKCASQSS